MNKMYNKRRFSKAPVLAFLGTLALLHPGAAWAQGTLNPARNEPLEVTADGTLEWKRNEQIFVATKNARARQGDAAIAAQILTANYRDGKGSDLEIWRLTAAENVVITSRESSAYGEKATYDIDSGLAVLTGGDLRMTSPDQTVTATESFEYWVPDGRLVAIGNAKVVRPNVKGGQDILEADKIAAVMKDDAQGQRVLHSLEAIGNVVITTPTEVVRGAYGVYKSETNTAEITGGVQITRGPNILEGERADVDMNTNTSRMYGSKARNGQVRGVFYPSSEKKPDPAQEPAAAQP